MGGTVAQSCGFPDHSFVNDDDFYSGGGGNSSGAGGVDASAGGGNSGGSGGGGTGGNLATGGDSFVLPHEGGTRRGDSGVGHGDGGPSPEGGDGGDACPEGFSECGSTCVDLLSDAAHCGTCAKVCATGDVCSAGECDSACAGGLTACKPAAATTSICVDTTNDENHCGRCNAPCPKGTVCDGSQCQIDCGTKNRCGTTCVDFATDDTHCGNCTTNCTTKGQKCSGGACQQVCTPLATCGSTCVNLTTDSANCGICGKACGPTQACVTGTCTTLKEDCQNGVDDDRDGLVDCADTADCSTGFSCASLPSGWQGPVAVWTGSAGTAPPCSASGAYKSQFLTANQGLVVPPYTCPSCSCTLSQDTFCDDLSFILDDSTTCTSDNYWDSLTAPENGACQKWELCDANPTAQSAALQGKPSDYVHGTCSATQAPAALPSPSWTSEVRACGAPASVGGGCNIGQCMPKPSAPYGNSLCIFRSGVASCPAEYPTQRPAASQPYYQTVLEGRSCSACGCQAQCGGTVTAYTTPDCTGAGAPLKFNGGNTCTQIPGDLSQGSQNTGSCPAKRDTRSFQWTNPGASCSTSPSTLNGAPSPESPVTVCCQ
jgi:hypothetical protein